jgi:hypothetical protein
VHAVLERGAARRKKLVWAEDGARDVRTRFGSNIRRAAVCSVGKYNPITMAMR